MLTSKTFWADAAERALKTFAQALLGALTILSVSSDAPIHQIPWGEALAIAATAVVFSVLTSLASGGKTGTPSVLRPSRGGVGGQ